ncbi:MAG: hypothetical protein IKT98_07825 [Selenomonadaceae bacterium]|nr:hypothetical protein [Selenomonadaceae bacterium]
MDTKKILMAIGCILILIGFVGIGIQHNLRKLPIQPVNSLKAAREALEKHDLETFKKYVDTDAIIEVAAKEILTAQINSEILPTAYSMDELQNRYENQLKPEFINSARAALDEYILTGAVNFPYYLNDAQNFLNKSGVTSCEIKSFSTPHLVGNEMLSSIIFYNAQMKFSFEIVVELEPDDKVGWRITNARGFEDYYNGYRSALRRRLDSLNAPIGRQMDEIFKVKSFKVKSSDGDEYGFSKTLNISLKCDIHYDKPLAQIIGNVIMLGKDGKEHFSPFVIDMIDQPQGIQTLEVTKTLNPFVRADVDAMRHGLRKKDLHIEVTEIIFEDGTNLKLLDQLPE